MPRRFSRRRPTPPLLALVIVLLLVAGRWLTRPQEAPPPPPAGSGEFVVKRAVDGDTLLLTNGNRVRLIGVDTPETKHPNLPVQPFGPEASGSGLGPERWLVAAPAFALPLVLCGFLARRQRPHFLFFLAAATLFGLLVLGAATPLFSLYYALPAGNLFRISTRMAFVYLFLVAMIAGVGLQGVMEWMERWPAGRRVDGLLQPR